MIDIKFTRGAPEYAQVVEQIELAIARGTLKAGERLSPVRELAAQLGVNASTVARAYRDLEQAGVVETHGRRGTIVATGRDQQALRAVRDARLRSLAERAVVEALAQGYSTDEVEAALDLQLAAWREAKARGVPSTLEAAVPSEGLKFAGSHDLALESLWARVRQAHGALKVTAGYVGSLDGLLALLHGEAELAGSHILDEASGEYNVPILRRLFLGVPLCAVTLAEREQGLIVRPSNPLRLKTWADLGQPGLQFVNRQIGSGTRTLLDHHLRVEHISAGSISGYDFVVPTHLASAAAVDAGKADVALGLYAAARAFGLGFVPLARERYDLILALSNRDRWPFSAVLDILRSAEFRSLVRELGGYDTTHTGEEIRI